MTQQVDENNVVQGGMLSGSGFEELQKMMKGAAGSSDQRARLNNVFQNQRQPFVSEKESVCQIGDEALKAAALDYSDVGMSQ